MRYLLIILFVWAFAKAQGQNQPELYQLQMHDLNEGEVITTSRGKAEKSAKAAASVIVITEKNIKNRGYISLLDVFQDLPDFKVEQGVDPRWMNDVSIRGIHRMDRFIVLIDGVRASSPTNDVIPIMENYPVHLAKQIEIVYGPASALYGADAFAGVINIITKSEGNTGSIAGGSFYSGTGNLFWGRNIGKARLVLGGQYHRNQQANYWEVYPKDYAGIDSLRTGTFNSVFGPIPVPAGVSPAPETDPIRAHGLYASISTAKLKISFFNNYAQLPSTMAGSPNNVVYNKKAIFGHGISMGNVVYTAHISDKIRSQTYFTSSYYRLNPQSNFWNVYTGFQPAYLFSFGLMNKAEEIISYTPRENISITAGATFEHFISRPRGHDLNEVPESLNPKGVIIGSRLPNNPDGIEADIPKIIFTNTGFFAQMQWGVTPSINLTLGSRYDYNTRFGHTINPRLGLVADVSPKFTVKAMLGSAYLAPSPLMAYDQFGSFVSFDNGSTYQSFFMRLPNPNLQPQKVVSAELSGRYSISKRLSVSATAYASRLTGLFDYEVNGPIGKALHNNSYKGWPVFTVEVSVNQGRQINYGGNVQLDWQTALSGRSSIHYYASLSIVSGTVDRDGDGPLPLSEIPAVSPLMFKTGMEFKKGKFMFAPRILAISKQRVFATTTDPSKRQTIPGYLLANAQVSYQYSSKIGLFLRAQNLLDLRYYNVNLGAAPQQSGGGAAQAELANGAPQPPLNVNLGINASF